MSFVRRERESLCTHLNTKMDDLDKDVYLLCEELCPRDNNSMLLFISTYIKDRRILALRGALAL